MVVGRHGLQEAARGVAATTSAAAEGRAGGNARSAADRAAATSGAAPHGAAGAPGPSRPHGRGGEAASGRVSKGSTGDGIEEGPHHPWEREPFGGRSSSSQELDSRLPCLTSAYRRNRRPGPRTRRRGGSVGDSSTARLSLSIDDSTAREIVRRERNPDLVAGNDAYVVLPHLSGKMSQDDMTVFELDAKHGVGERLFDNALNLDCFLFCHSSLPMDGPNTMETKCICQPEGEQAEPSLSASAAELARIALPVNLGLPKPRRLLLLSARRLDLSLRKPTGGLPRSAFPIDFLIEIIHGWMLKNQGVGR